MSDETVSIHWPTVKVTIDGVTKDIEVRHWSWDDEEPRFGSRSAREMRRRVPNWIEILPQYRVRETISGEYIATKDRDR